MCKKVITLPCFRPQYQYPHCLPKHVPHLCGRVLASDPSAMVRVTAYHAIKPSPYYRSRQHLRCIFKSYLIWPSDKQFWGCILRRGWMVTLQSIVWSNNLLFVPHIPSIDIYMDVCARSRYQGKGLLITSHIYRGVVITCPCPWYLLLAHKSSYAVGLFEAIAISRCIIQSGSSIVWLINEFRTNICGVNEIM